jgi:DNA-binding MarR family transcriptional regulator
MDFITENDEANESLLIHDIARLSKNDFDRRVRELGLTRSQWLAIGTLRRNPGISQSGLAEILDVEPITVARTIDRLEKSGWIERRPDTSDRRVNRLYLTDRVQGVVAQMRALALKMRQEIAAGLSREEHQALVSILRKMKNNLNDKTQVEP